MTDATDNAAPPPPKKKFGFKKAAWQMEPKTEERDMFSHASDFSTIVAEEARRKSEQKKKAEQAHKRKLDEERKSKRRRVSAEAEESLPSTGTRSATRSRRLASKGRSKTPLSPTRHRSPSDSLEARYDSLTKSSSSSIGTAKKAEIVDLDSDLDDEDGILRDTSPSPRPIAIHSRPDSRRESSEELEEVDDPHIAAIKAEARAQAAAKPTEKEPTQSASTPPEPDPVAIVQLLINSEIPNTKPLLVKVKTDTTLGRPREAWCAKQGFTPEGTSRVFLTWKNRKMYDYTKVLRLGMKIENGYVSVLDDPTIYDEENLPKIYVEAWTPELWKKRQAEMAVEAAAAKNAVIEVEEEEPEVEPEPQREVQVSQVRLFLKAKGKEDFRIRVRSTTTIEELTKAYRAGTNVPQGQPITLMWDGERLKPMDTIEDVEIEDMDAIEVHFK